MKVSAKRLVWISALFLVASLATCHFGVQHEINKIPPEIRAQMSDFDWIGSKWIFRGMGILAVAIIFAATALVLWLIQRRRIKKSGQ
ncbi:MAG TPA: hypothetical protein PLD20_00030 [Blastocatellia bacterium]|nr:hypothetical protein [Blastocatellia bacterium]HMV81985.1 hypothetical protein [Blastocatellia bacterium]HMX24906.1 hypothetical protein [Blastocatellia bacterium]HMY76304.1 hypothetical protein [Blastocatellia bacterium]HMZ16321.1 hypothetical protein [Blastocatellia bacterium]